MGILQKNYFHYLIVKTGPDGVRKPLACSSSKAKAERYAKSQSKDSTYQLYKVHDGEDVADAVNERIEPIKG